jgi:lysozyme
MLDEAEAYLSQDLATAVTATMRYCPTLVTEPERRLAAIVDFTFNLGAGRLQTLKLRRRINHGTGQTQHRSFGAGSMAAEEF